MEILRTLKPASRSLSPLHPTAGGAGRHSRSGRENTPPLHPNVQASSPTLPKKPSATTTPKVDLFSKESTRSEEYPPDSSKNCSNPYVKVVVRVRPVNSQEEKGNACCVRKVSDDSLAVGDRKYTVNSVLGPESTQEDVFKLVGVPLVENSLAGFNTSIVSYGQTGSGKTYTMWGPPSAMVDNRFIDGRQGIVPRIFQLLFSEIQRKQENSEEKQENYQCRCSFLEIHNGQINDLLDPTQRSLQIRDDSKNGFHVENLTDEYVTTVEDVTQILIKGLSNRKVGATSMNSKSSRSHVIFTCVIESWCKGPSSSCFSSSKSSKINLIDLAGSDIDEFDGVSKQCIKEGRHVKKSLARLGKLVNILADVTSSGRDQKNLYMDSCLTHLLTDTLGGNSKTTLICAISSDDRCKSGTLSTLRFGERAKNIENKAVVNEITEDDVNGLSDQIRQLKEELIRTKSYRDIPNGTNTAEHFKGHNARDSLKLLRVNLNRSLILPHIDIESEEEMDVDEEDVRELCDQISTLHSSSEDKLKDMLENKDQLCDTSEVSLELEKDEEIEEEHSEVSEPTACSSIAASTKSSLVCGDAFEDANDNPLLGSPTKCSLSISPCQLVPVLQDPTLCSSPKFDAKFKKNVISPGLLSVGKRSASGCSISNSIKDSPGKVDGVRSSLQSTKLSPTESLAASLHHGLQMIDYHHRNSASRRSFVALSFDHLALNSCHSVEKDNSGIQTSPYEQRNISSFLCSSCKKVVENENDVISDKSDMDIMPISETSDSNTLQKSSLKEDNIVPTKASKREMELEVLCAEREARIKHLSSLIDQCKQGDCQSSTREQSKDAQILSVASLTDDGLTTVKGLRSEGNTSLEAEHTLLVDKSIKQSLASKPEDSLKQQDGSTAFDSCEREALLCEIESLRNQLKKSYTTNSVDDSLLDQIRNGSTPPSGVTEEELEKERQRWTESESRWISLTEELRLDLESNRRFAEKKEIELNQEKECTAELDDALQRAIHGHAMIVEHYVELQENYNDLFEKHRKVMEGIAEVKKAALKAGRKGSGSAFAAALSAELSTLRIDREKERAYLKEQNRRLRIQLRDTAEAVHAAGELLVRLREAEAAVSQAEAKYAGAHQEIDRLRKQNDKMKKKHAMEIITMKHYLAESRLPESALEPFYLNESETVENSKPPASDEDQSWRAAFGPAYR